MDTLILNFRTKVSIHILLIGAIIIYYLEKEVLQMKKIQKCLILFLLSLVVVQSTTTTVVSNPYGIDLHESIFSVHDV